MRTFILCWTAILLMAVNIQNVNAQRNCATKDLTQLQQDDPKHAEQLRLIEEHTQRFINKSSEEKINGVITIPVVVHVIYQSNAQNISDAQIQSQMQVLNDDFRRMNSDANNTWSQAADTEIEFCLATVDPNGNATSGITRKYYNRSEWGTNDAMKYSSNGGVDAWSRDSYLNMWICNIGGGILGYAQFPGSGSAATDGVVMSPQYFGTIGSAQAPFDGGRTTTHEVGHWLNLRHIWGDGNCNADDFVSDTPTSDAANYGCSTGHVSCSSTDMVQNYMDYSDDGCMNLFTQGQKTRMRALFDSGGFRASLLNSGGCGSGGGGGSTATCSDGIQNQGETGVDCGGPCTACSTGCSQNEVTISITFDNYPEETSWAITNSSGATVASGGTYASQADGSTLTISECLPNGCYDFTISDAYGDGICCSYGNGAYSVIGGGSTLASGSSFTNSETTNFCVGSTPPASCDTPTGLGVSGLTQTEGTLTWNVVNGAVSYDIEIVAGGTAYPFNSATNSQSITGFTAGSTYTFRVMTNCDGASSGWSGYYEFTTPGDGGGGGGGGGCTNVTIDSESFESGWGIWNDGGSDSYRNNYANYASSGSYTIRLRDNTSSSVMTTDNLNLNGFEEVTVDFSYYPVGMDSNEDFWLQVSTDGGSSYSTIETWVRGTDFNNNTSYTESVTITGTFTSTTKIRFRVDASVNNDRVYFDDVTISGCSSGVRAVELTGTTDEIPGNGTDIEIEDIDIEVPGKDVEIVGFGIDVPGKGEGTRQASEVHITDMNIFPNPANEYINVEYTNIESTEVQLSIMDMTGRVIQSQNLNEAIGQQRTQLDINALTSGFYFIRLVAGDTVQSMKFVKP